MTLGRSASRPDRDPPANGDDDRRSGIVRFALAALVIGAVAVAGLGITRLDVDTQASSFVPGDDEAAQGWQELQERFGGDPILVLVSTDEPGGLLDPGPLETLVQLEGRLAGTADVAVVYGPGSVLNQVAGRAQELILELTGQRDALRQQAETAARDAGADEAAIGAAGDEAVADFDVRYGSLLVEALPAGLPTLRNGSFARAVALDADGRVRSSLRWVLPDPTHAAVYVRPREGLSQDAVASLVDAVEAQIAEAGLDDVTLVSGSPVIAAGLGDQIRDEAPRLAVASVVAVAIAFAFFGPGRGVRRLRPLLAGLAGSAVVLGIVGWTGAAVSVGVLAFLPTILGVGTDFPIYAATSTRRHVIVAATAAAAGFASMALSPMPFVREFGILLACGVLATAAMGLLLVRRDADASAASGLRPTGDRSRSSGRRRGIAAALVVAGVAGWLAFPAIGAETRPQALASGVTELDEATEAESILGASGELAVRLQAIGTERDAIDPETLAWFREAEAAIVTTLGDRLRPVVTPERLFGFLGDDPTDDQVDAAIRLVPGYLSRAVVPPDQREAIASFGLRLGDLDEQRALIEDLEDVLPAPPGGTRASVDGLPVVAARAVDLTAGTRVLPSLVGIAAFGAVVLLGLGDRRSAVVAIGSAIVSTGLGATVLWAVGRDLSPLALSLGSLSVAVGGEFALVARERLLRGEASPFRPVVVAAVTSVAGFVAMTVSSLVLLREFAAVLAGSVVIAALVGCTLAWATTLPPAAPDDDPTAGPPRRRHAPSDTDPTPVPA